MLLKIIGLISAGLLGGIFGGMGMGGGTLLIPLLTVFCGIPQHTAQAINLVSFIPMAVAALIIHLKQKNVDYKGVLLIIIPACIISVGGAFLAQLIRPKLMSILFGAFLTVLGIAQFAAEIVSIIRNKKKSPLSPAALREEEKQNEIQSF